MHTSTYSLKVSKNPEKTVYLVAIINSGIVEAIEKDNNIKTTQEDPQ